ncbi:hypothetical protein NDU88_007970, partial [Pleurodeles waltl]
CQHMTVLTWEPGTGGIRGSSVDSVTVLTWDPGTGGIRGVPVSIARLLSAGILGQ